MMKVKKYQTPSDNLTKDSSVWGDLSKIITNVSNLVKDFYNENLLAIQSAPRRIQNKWNKYFPSEIQKTIDGPGTDIVMLDKDAIRVTPDTEQQGTLFNEFVETKGNPSIRKAEWYKLNQDKNVGDRNIPVKNFTYYGGLENGAFKVMPLNQFNDTTTVIPARNLKKETVPIKEILNAENKEAQERLKLEQELIKLENEDSEFLKTHAPWYVSQPMFYEVYQNPYIVPKTGEKLSKEGFENISKRLYLYDTLLNKYKDTEFTVPDDSLSVIETSNQPVYDDITGEYEGLEQYYKAVNDYVKRRNNYIKSVKNIYKEKTKDIKSFSSELSPEEEMVYKINFRDDHKNIPFSVTHTNLFSKNKILVPISIANLITPSSMHFKHSITPTEKRFINSYDPKLETIYTESNKLRKKILNLKTKIQELSPEKPIRVVTVNNDTIPVSTYNASVLDKKSILGNKNGSMFIADFGNMSSDQLENKVNPYLKENPSVLFMPDMGAYSLYGLQNGKDPEMLKNTYMDVSKKPTYQQYWNQFTESESKAPYNPNEHYLIGVKKLGGLIDLYNLSKGDSQLTFDNKIVHP